MIQIVCGEDVVSARSYVAKLKGHYKDKSYLVQDIQPNEIFDIQKLGEHSASLFEEQRVFFVRNLGPYLSKSRKFSPTVKELASNEEVYVIDWEEGKSAYEIGVKDKKLIKEFKPSSTIFSFLDSCVPKNRKQFITQLHNVLETQDEMFTYIMLCRHIRSLITARYNSFADRIAPWQKMKLSSLTKQWEEQKLIQFYEGLAKIDQSIKTSATPFSIKQSLEILALYYL